MNMHVLVYDYEKISLYKGNAVVHIPVIGNDIVATLDRYAESPGAVPFGGTVVLVNPEHVYIQSFDGNGMPPTLTEREAQLTARNKTIPIAQKFSVDTADCVSVFRSNKQERWQATIGRYDKTFMQKLKIAIEKNKGKIIQSYPLVECIANSNIPKDRSNDKSIVPIIFPLNNQEITIYINKETLNISMTPIPPTGGHQQMISDIISMLRRLFGAVATNTIIAPAEMPIEDVRIFNEQYDIEVLRITGENDDILSWRDLAYHGAISLIDGKHIRPPVSIIPLDDIINAINRVSIISGATIGTIVGFIVVAFLILQVHYSNDNLQRIKNINQVATSNLIKAESGLPAYTNQEIIAAVSQKQSIVQSMQTIISLGNYSVENKMHWNSFTYSPGDRSLSLHVDTDQLRHALDFIRSNSNLRIKSWQPNTNDGDVGMLSIHLQNVDVSNTPIPASAATPPQAATPTNILPTSNKN